MDEWVKFNQPGDLHPPSLIADEDSPQQRAVHQQVKPKTLFVLLVLSLSFFNSYLVLSFFCVQVPDFGYSPAPQASKHSNITKPERKPRPVAPPPPPPPPRRESPSPAKPSRPSPSQQQPIQVHFAKQGS